MAKLTGKVALITGAAVGLGEGIATAYAKYGAKLCMVDLSPEVEKNTTLRSLPAWPTWPIPSR